MEFLAGFSLWGYDPSVTFFCEQSSGTFPNHQSFVPSKVFDVWIIRKSLKNSLNLWSTSTRFKWIKFIQPFFKSRVGDCLFPLFHWERVGVGVWWYERYVPLLDGRGRNVGFAPRKSIIGLFAFYTVLLYWIVDRLKFIGGFEDISYLP